MDLETACKTIAFYDGYRDAFNPCDNNFEKNNRVNQYLILNNLIPVWQKIKKIGFNLRFDEGEFSFDSKYYLIDNVGDEYGRKMPSIEKPLNERLVIATALAINEIEKQNA